MDASKCPTVHWLCIVLCGIEPVECDFLIYKAGM